ncbi:hypothetical protein [Paenibacillus pseudetheri]|nr:hypothetical protein [Paenibacillus pseudetheri]
MRLDGIYLPLAKLLLMMAVFFGVGINLVVISVLVVGERMTLQ